MWFTTFARGSTGAVQRSCQSMQSTGGASAGDPRRSRPAQRAVRGGGRASQSSKSCASRDDAASGFRGPVRVPVRAPVGPGRDTDSVLTLVEFTMAVMDSSDLSDETTDRLTAYQRHGFWRGEALVPGTGGGPSAQAFAFCFWLRRVPEPGCREARTKDASKPHSPRSPHRASVIRARAGAQAYAPRRRTPSQHFSSRS